MSSNLSAESEFYRKRVVFRDAAPVCDTSAYSSGDVIGALITLSGVVQADDLGGFIHSVTVTDDAAQDAALTLVFFDAQPAASTFTDQAAPVIAAADVSKIVGVIGVAAADYFPVGTGLSVASVRGAGLSFDCASGGNDLYLAILSAGTPTYAAATDLRVRVGLAQG